MMAADGWLQLGIAGAALFVLLVTVVIFARLFTRIIGPLRAIATELGLVRERIARVEGKLDAHFDWTPVETPRPNVPTQYSITPKKSRGQTGF